MILTSRRYHHRKTPRLGAQHPHAVIVTGGASEVGSCAVQLAASAGYDVFSTSSPKEFAYVESFGASNVFDHDSGALVADLVQALDGRELVGTFTVGAKGDQVCAAVMKERLRKSPELPTKKLIALAGSSWGGPDSIKDRLGSFRLMIGFMTMMAKNVLTKCLTSIKIKFIWVVGVVHPESCVSHVYVNFLESALAKEQFVLGPEPYIVGCGLDKINEGLEIIKKGTSARKIVVSIAEPTRP